MLSKAAIVVLDGAGTKRIPALADPGHKYSDLFEDVRDRIAGACDHGVKDEVVDVGIEPLADYLLLTARAAPSPAGGWR